MPCHAMPYHAEREPHMSDVARCSTKRVCQGSASAATACSFTEHFPRTQDPVVIALIQDKSGQRCLLGRNKNFPTGVPQTHTH